MNEKLPISFVLDPLRNLVAYLKDLVYAIRFTVSLVTGRTADLPMIGEGDHSALITADLAQRQAAETAAAPLVDDVNELVKLIYGEFPWVDSNQAMFTYLAECPPLESIIKASAMLTSLHDQLIIRERSESMVNEAYGLMAKLLRELRTQPHPDVDETMRQLRLIRDEYRNLKLIREAASTADLRNN
ncbi:hypothetical protein IPJ72_02670 [Candidatus Peregrinibacteria bacterium]|nr:MAG: hypothetical protein IPJ72_02670 [Candidatus Peregrinibacteria bacterium]